MREMPFGISPFFGLMDRPYIRITLQVFDYSTATHKSALAF